MQYFHKKVIMSSRFAPRLIVSSLPWALCIEPWHSRTASDDKEYHTANQLQKKCRNEDTRTFTIDLFVTHGSEKQCSNWVAQKK